jgi:hypothetical protein
LGVRQCPRFPVELQRHLALIRNLTYQLAVGDKQFFATAHGPDTVDAAWKAAQEYAEVLRKELQE